MHSQCLPGPDEFERVDDTRVLVWFIVSSLKMSSEGDNVTIDCKDSLYSVLLCKSKKVFWKVLPFVFCKASNKQKTS